MFMLLFAIIAALYGDWWLTLIFVGIWLIFLD